MANGDGGDGEEEREHHPTRMRSAWNTLEGWVYVYIYMFVCAMSHGYVDELSVQA